MTFAEQFEQEIRSRCHIAAVRVHLHEPKQYREATEKMPRTPTHKRDVVKPPKEGTLRFVIAQKLKAAPDGLTAPELRAGMPSKITPSVIAGVLWTMDQEYREIEPKGSRVVGPKTCRVYRWIQR